MMEEPTAVGDENDAYGDVSLGVLKIVVCNTIKVGRVYLKKKLRFKKASLLLNIIYHDVHGMTDGWLMRC